MNDITFNPSEDYQSTISVMCDLFKFWNRLYFNNSLATPVITVMQDTRGRAYGWFVPHEVWTDGTSDGAVEINMSSQYLNRPLTETAATMLHEMCHLYAYVEGIKDTSRMGYYHNQKFKTIAEEHGLVVTNSGSYHGWCITHLTPESEEALRGFVQKGKIIYDKRPKSTPNDFTTPHSDEQGEEGSKEKRPSSTRKYVCNKCGMSVRATKTVRVICADCNQLLEEV